MASSITRRHEENGQSVINVQWSVIGGMWCCNGSHFLRIVSGYRKLAIMVGCASL